MSGGKGVECPPRAFHFDFNSGNFCLLRGNRARCIKWKMVKKKGKFPKMEGGKFKKKGRGKV